MSSSLIISGTSVGCIVSSLHCDGPWVDSTVFSSIRGLLTGIIVDGDSELALKSPSEQDTLAQCLARGRAWIADGVSYIMKEN